MYEKATDYYFYITFLSLSFCLSQNNEKMSMGEDKKNGTMRNTGLDSVQGEFYQTFKCYKTKGKKLPVLFWKSDSSRQHPAAY